MVVPKEASSALGNIVGVPAKADCARAEVLRV